MIARRRYGGSKSSFDASYTAGSRLGRGAKCCHGVALFRIPRIVLDPSVVWDSRDMLVRSLDVEEEAGSARPASAGGIA